MNSRDSHPSSPIMKHLSPHEQEILLISQRRRVEYLQSVKRAKRCGKTAKRGLLIAACAAGLFTAGAGWTEAAEAPWAVSAPALFNEANAAQCSGRLGPAILGYERAQWLAPRDPAIAQNLHAARQKAGLADPTVPGWQRPAHWLAFDSLAALGSISLLLFTLLFFGTRFVPITLRGLSRIVASMAGVITLLAASAVALRWVEIDRAVIVGNQPVAHLAPAANSAASFDLKPGEVVCVEDSYGNFVRIHATDGRSGWVARSEVQKIIPAES